MGLFNIGTFRATNRRIGELTPVVEANFSRLGNYFSTHFKVPKKSPLDYLTKVDNNIYVEQSVVDEYLRLKREFEREFKILYDLVEEIKPKTFLDDDRFYVQCHNRLVNMISAQELFDSTFFKHYNVCIKS